MSEKIKESRMLRNVIITGLAIMAIFFFIKVAYGVTPIIPRTRHFIHKVSFWDRLLNKQSEHFIVKVKVDNSKNEPVEVMAKCVVIDISENGDIKQTQQVLKVEPAKVWLYPDSVRTFKIYFPVKKDSSTLAVFIATPIVKPEKGKITISMSYGYVLAATLGEYKPERPAFRVIKEDGHIVAMVTNVNKVLIEGTLRLKGEDETARHYFIQAGRKRIFKIPDNGYNTVVLDVGSLPVQLGVRLGE